MTSVAVELTELDAVDVDVLADAIKSGAMLTFHGHTIMKRGRSDNIMLNNNHKIFGAVYSLSAKILYVFTDAWCKTADGYSFKVEEPVGDMNHSAAYRQAHGMNEDDDQIDVYDVLTR